MSKDINSVKDDTKQNQVMTREEIAKLMGLNVPTKLSATKTSNHSLKKVITDRVNEVIHETLCKEFGEYYFEIGETMVQHTKKSGEVLSSFVKGYKLVLPKDSATFDNWNLIGGFQIGNPTLYCQGLQTQDTPYFVKNGKTIFFKHFIAKKTTK